MAAKKQFNLYLDEDLIKAVKHSAIEADKRMSDHVADILMVHFDMKKRVSARMAEIRADQVDRDRIE